MANIATAYVTLKIDSTALNSQLNNLSTKIKNSVDQSSRQYQTSLRNLSSGINKAVIPIKTAFNAIALPALGIAAKAIHSLLKTNSAAAVEFRSKLANLNMSFIGLGEKILKVSIFGKTFGQWIDMAARSINNISIDRLSKVLNTLAAIKLSLLAIQGITITLKGLEGISKLSQVARPAIGAATGNIIGGASAGGTILLVSKYWSNIKDTINATLSILSKGLANWGKVPSLKNYTKLFIVVISNIFTGLGVVLGGILATLSAVGVVIWAYKRISNKVTGKDILAKQKSMDFMSGLTIFKIGLDAFIDKFNKEFIAIGKQIEKAEITPNLSLTNEQLNNLSKEIEYAQSDTNNLINRIQDKIYKARELIDATKFDAKIKGIAPGEGAQGELVRQTEESITNFEKQIEEGRKTQRELLEKQKDVSREVFARYDQEKQFNKNLQNLEKQRFKLTSFKEKPSFSGGVVGAEDLRGQVQQDIIAGINEQIDRDIETAERQKELVDINKDMQTAQDEQNELMRRSFNTQDEATRILRGWNNMTGAAAY
jgi:hypothetical protein